MVRSEWSEHNPVNKNLNHALGFYGAHRGIREGQDKNSRFLMNLSQKSSFLVKLLPAGKRLGGRGAQSKDEKRVQAQTQRRCVIRWIGVRVRSAPYYLMHDLNRYILYDLSMLLVIHACHLRRRLPDRRASIAGEANAGKEMLHVQ